MSRLRSLRKNWLTVLISLIALASLVVNRGFRSLLTNSLALRRMDRRLMGLRKEESELNSQIHALKNNDAVLENAARRELGYMKPGEIEYRFRPPRK